jgi:hypothetical protein
VALRRQRRVEFLLWPKRERSRCRLAAVVSRFRPVVLPLCSADALPCGKAIQPPARFAKYRSSNISCWNHRARLSCSANLWRPCPALPMLPSRACETAVGAFACNARTITNIDVSHSTRRSTGELCRYVLGPHPVSSTHQRPWRCLPLYAPFLSPVSCVRFASNPQSLQGPSRVPLILQSLTLLLTLRMSWVCGAR